jgi:hypothetical protein
MRFLFVVFLLSICALLWAAIAVARHIRRHDAQTKRDSPAEIVPIEARTKGAPDPPAEGPKIAKAAGARSALPK